jgi:hypothetical protein
MGLRDTYEDYRGKIRFADLDLASRSMALLWLEKFETRVFRICFPQVHALSLKQDISQVINQSFLEGYILARSAHATGTTPVSYSHPETAGSVEEKVLHMTCMYEEADIGTSSILEEIPGVESMANLIITNAAGGGLFQWVEERELLKLNLEYALKAGYLLAIFERRVLRERA